MDSTFGHSIFYLQTFLASSILFLFCIDPKHVRVSDTRKSTKVKARYESGLNVIDT